MATAETRLAVIVVAGQTAMRKMHFSHGQKFAPFTAGFEGTWRIFAPGVAREHLSLLFDGEQLFVAAVSAEHPVHVNGTPIDTRWWMLPPGAEVRFGHACLRTTQQADAQPNPDLAGAPTEFAAPPDPSAKQVPGTYLEGAGAWLRNHPAAASDDKHRTQLYDPAAVVLAAPPPARAPSPIARQPELGISSIPPSAEPAMPSTLRRPVVPDEPTPVVIAAPRPPEPAPVIREQKEVELVQPQVAPKMETIAVDPAIWAALPRALEEAKSKPENRLAEAWRSTSWVKKITFVLLPLAAVAVLWPEPPQAPRRPASARASASAAPAPVKAPATIATIATAKPPAAVPTPAPAPTPAATPIARADSADERSAIDAAFQGRWEEATRLYERLAASRPDDVVFHEAARILRETKAHAQ